MKRLTQADGEALIMDYEASGLSQRQFAAKANIAIWVFNYWWKKIRSLRDSGSYSASCQFVEICSASEPSVEAKDPAVIEPAVAVYFDGVCAEFGQLPPAAWFAEFSLAARRDK